GPQGQACSDLTQFVVLLEDDDPHACSLQGGGCGQSTNPATDHAHLAFVLVHQLPPSALASCGNWSILPSPNSTVVPNGLSGVAAVSANDVWALSLLEPLVVPITREYTPSEIPQVLITCALKPGTKMR